MRSDRINQPQMRTPAIRGPTREW